MLMKAGRYNALDNNLAAVECISSWDTPVSALLCTSATDHGRYFRSNTKPRKENHWIGHSLTDTERNRESLPFQRFAERRLKFPLGGSESPRGQGIGLCNIGDYG